MIFMLLCVITHLLSIVQILCQQKSDQHLNNWQMRLFGQLSSIYVVDEIIFYRNTLNQNGKILKSTGSVQTRNAYIMCDYFNYINYDPKQKVVQLFNNGFSILAQWEISDNIDSCLIGLNGELIIIAGQKVYSTINERFQKYVENQIIYAGYIFEIPTLVLQKKNQICIYSIKSDIQEDYCVRSKKDGKVVEFGKTLIYYDNYFAYNLKDKIAKEINIDLIHKTIQFLGFSQTLVIKTQKHKQIVNLKGQVEYEFHSSSCVIENLETQKYYFFFEQQLNQIKIESLDRETHQLNLQIIELSSNSNIISGFLIDLSKRQFLIQYQDLQTVLIENKQILWSIEQSLISIDSVFYMKYKNEKQKYSNSYYESLKKNGYNPFFVLQNLISRIFNEIKDLQQFVTQFINKEENYQIVKNEREQYYALKQKVCFLTTLKLVLCYDSKEQQLIQKLKINNLDQSYNFVAIHKIDPILIQDYRNEDGSQVHVLFYYSDQKQKLSIFIVDLNAGLIKQVGLKASKKILWTLPYKIVGSSQHNNIIMFIDQEENLYTFPNNQNIKSEEIILYKNDNGILKGYKLIGKKSTNIWTIHMRDKILLIRSSNSFGQVNTRVADWDDRKVIFKLIDYSNFAVLTSDEDLLKLYIVNGKTGKILFQGVQNEVDLDQQINLVFDEHQVFVSYYNQAQMMFEIWTVEIYHSKIQNSFIQMLEDYYFSQNILITNYYHANFDAYFLQQVYGYPLGIKYLELSKSQKSLTKKNLLIITSFGQLHSLDRNLVSARRGGQQILEHSLQSTNLAPYQYEIPINYQNILTNSQLFDFQRFSLEATNLESSTLLLVYGSDIFFTIITPNDTYDMLKDEFNYKALTLTIILIILATQIFKKLVKSSQQTRQFQMN